MFGMATKEQSASVMSLLEAEMDEFQRFPTFLAARIQDYNSSKIGDGGPYDLCAAGRYWCWDAAFWSWRRNRGMLRKQLATVAAMARSEDYIMGERYDMDHVYYIDGSPWHGAAHYYEYPCVFAWVLLHDYVGVQPSLEADLLVAPRLADHGSVTLGQSAYRLSYTYSEDEFELYNLAVDERTFRLDLSALYLQPDAALVASGADQASLRQAALSRGRRTGFANGSIIKLGGGESVKVRVQDIHW